ncbi:MAG: hybrid sensor histidine kinase/response regulator [Desulfuromonadales bacterium]|nr:MAG: hybrid sensor histidine kinase/response regulator [Desulfuromonadales bacterium]
MTEMPPLRVLIIDDSPLDAELILRELRKGFSTQHVRVDTAQGMLDALADGSWDIVISDYVMPLFSGLNAIALLRDKGHDLPLIVVSGKVGDDAAVETMRAGASDYIIKDNLARLVPAITRELKDAAVRRKRREAENALRLTEAKYRILVEQSPVSIVITDRNGTIEYVNPRFSLVTGYSAEDAVGQNPRILKSGHVSDEDYRQLWDTITKGLEWHGELLNKKKNGELFWERASISAIRDANGIITHFVGIKEDITEQRRTSDQLRQVQKMEAIGQLAGGVAHDFNNLLTIINGYSSLILHEMPKEDPFRFEIERILHAGERAADLTHQLLAFSRRQILEPKEIHINQLVKNVEKMLKRLIRENVVLQTRLADRPGMVKADPGQVEQIIMNLVVNARDALENGGVVTIETANAILDEVFTRENPGAVAGSYVMLAVHDNGIGMSQEVKRKIFEPFFTTKEQGRGTGLGLATVYGIVKQSGGYIRVDSEPGNGSSFFIYLPRIESATELETISSGKAATLGTETILVIEDEAGVLNLAVRTLSLKGYNVLQASRPAEAEKLFEHNRDRVDLVLTDVVMPGKNGPALVEEFRGKRPGLKIIFMSGYTDDTIAPQHMNDHQTAFIRKPFTPDGLTEKVREVLDSRVEV